MAFNCTISLLPPSCTLQVMLLFASYSWVVRPILNCGGSYYASSPVTKRDQYLKWAEPRYGASPGPGTCPARRRRHPKSGLPNGSISRTSPFLTRSEWVFPDFHVFH